MGKRLDGQRIAFLVTDGVEQVELTEPWQAIEAEGGEPVLVPIHGGTIPGFKHTDPGTQFTVDELLAQVDVTQFDGFVFPTAENLPAFYGKLLDEFEEGIHEELAAATVD